MIRAEVSVLPEDDNNVLVAQARQARERIRERFRAQARHLVKLEQTLKEFHDEYQQLQSEAGHQFEALDKLNLPTPPGALDAMLAAVRNLSAATLPKQVFDTLTEEASRMGVRAVAFDARGKAARGVAAHGFGPQLTEEALRSMVVPLSVDAPFRQVFETGGCFRGNSETLKKDLNLLIKLSPDSVDSILLLPIRSGGAVSAVLYADSGGKGALLPETSLELLTEFAGAQLDRLMVLAGGAPATIRGDAGRRVEPDAAPGLEPPAVAAGLEKERAAVASLTSAASASLAEASAPIIEGPLPPPSELPVAEATAPVGPPHAEASPELAAAPAPIESVPLPVSAMESQGATGAPPAPAVVAGVDGSQPGEAEQRIHKDARRFARLLVSEIELYNKAKVAEGRKNKDLYKRMKLDIERSRQTFEQRFGKTVGKQVDFFDDELVRTLAGNDPSLLGSDYPGHSV